MVAGASCGVRRLRDCKVCLIPHMWDVHEATLRLRENNRLQREKFMRAIDKPEKKKVVARIQDMRAPEDKG